GARRFDFDVDRDGLTDAGDGFGSAAEHQSEVAAFQWLGSDRPPRSLRIARDRADQLDLQSDRFCYAMHSEIADDVGGVFARPPNGVTFERNLRIFRDVEKIGTAQVVIAFGDAG